ncbi:MAG TPA: hypothetical protein VG476_14370 [Acidimicrobiales bacterium]|nr:hypothetical protein [Acidimicrobiales bacterium]
MGKARLAKVRLRVPRLRLPRPTTSRLTRRLVVCTIAASVLLGGGTAGALLSIRGTPVHGVRSKTASHGIGQVIQIDPGGPIVLAPDPSPAPAPTTTEPLLPPLAHPTPSSPPPPPVGAAALAEIAYPWQQLGYQIVFLGPRPDLMGQTIFDAHRIEIYLRSGESQQMVAHVLAHEIGHAADVAYNTSERRQQWLNLRGASTSQPWFGCDSCDDFSSPAGDYAETFSFWQVGPNADFSHLAPPPSRDQLQHLIPLFYASPPGGSGGSSGSGAPPPSGGAGSPPSSGSPPAQSCLTVVCTSHA